MGILIDMDNKRVFTLTLAADVDLVVRAEDAGRLWNGWAVPILTDEQAAFVGVALGEPELKAGPCDGLCWEGASVKLSERDR